MRGVRWVLRVCSIVIIVLHGVVVVLAVSILCVGILTISIAIRLIVLIVGVLIVRLIGCGRLVMLGVL